MPGRENSLTGESEAVKDSAGELNSYCQSTSGYPLNEAYEARLTGWLEGWHSRDAEIQRSEWTSDRLYTWALSRTPVKFNDQPAFSSLERIRGNSANADRIDAANAARFEQVTR